MAKIQKKLVFLNTLVHYNHRVHFLFGPRPFLQNYLGHHHQQSSQNSNPQVHYHHPRQQYGEEWLLQTLCLFLLISSTAAMALRGAGDSRGHGAKPRWINPCDLPGHVFDPNTDMEGAPPIRLAELYHSVKERARVAKEHAIHVQRDFLKMTFDDPDFVPATSVHRQSWLPKIPSPREPFFQEVTKEEAFRRSFEFLQYFAVGIEQIIMDQVIHGGQFISLFKDVEDHLTQVLCELQLGLFSLRVPTFPYVLRDVMKQEHRDIEEGSKRNIRDYLILRDYIKATQFVSQLFAHLERTL